MAIITIVPASTNAFAIHGFKADPALSVTGLRRQYASHPLTLGAHQRPQEFERAAVWCSAGYAASRHHVSNSVDVIKAPATPNRTAWLIPEGRQLRYSMRHRSK